MIQADSCQAGEVALNEPFSLSPSGGSRLLIVCEPTTASIRPQMVHPQWTVGLGWYIYIYLNRGDWLRLANYSVAAIVAVVVTLLSEDPATAAVAAIIAVYLAEQLGKHTAPPRGYCAELKFYYWGGFAGYKLVKRSC